MRRRVKKRKMLNEIIEKDAISILKDFVKREEQHLKESAELEEEWLGSMEEEE